MVATCAPIATQGSPVPYPADLSPGPPPPAVCVLVPTRNEAGNVAPLVSRLEDVLRPLDAEVLFVDDSTDATPEVVSRVASEAGVAVRLLHRAESDRVGGLGGAVIAGLRDTSAPWVVVMDGDLQHPPETVADLLKVAAGTPGLDLVVASRYAGGGAADGLASPFRGLVSRATTAAAEVAFPRRLSGVSDPMTGFFAVRRDAVDVAALRPQGFKILLEILARGPQLRVVEIPFVFAARGEGKSKATAREGWRYVSRLAALRLRSQPELAALLRFAAVGGTGVLVNLVALAVVLRLDGRSQDREAQAVAATFATQAAIAWNFLLTEMWVFSASRLTSRRWARFAGFWALSMVALGVQLPLAAALQPVLPGGYLTSTAAALGLLVLVRYLVCRHLVYRNRGAGSEAAAAVVGGAVVTNLLEVSR